jgi:23S rRNA (pseudouridine1915-N3)-methyltransferase
VKISLVYIGKPKSRPIQVIEAEYAKRIGRYCRFELRSLRDERAAAEVSKAKRVVLDPQGESWSSQDLANYIETAQADVQFIIGGAEGFSQEFRDGADRLLSLSKMTLPHELARLLMIEQIYRAFTILRNHPYPK